MSEAPRQMVSYAQHGEDVVLERAFADVAEGFYVDVGACVPVVDSVTLHFYERGWRGVNVEPDPTYYAELVRARERDVNLDVAVGAGRGRVTFYPTDIRGRGTLNPHIASEHDDRAPLQVEQVPLSEILATYAPPSGVDFLKVDVEGWEAEVLASADWKHVRPRVVVVEAVDLEGRPTHEEWEGTLLAAGYRFALFDGLNRFYCREEDAERLLPRLAVPANPTDDFRLAREVQLEADVQTVHAVLAETQSALDEARSALEAEQDMDASLTAALEAERAAHASLRTAFDAAQDAHAETRRLLDLVLGSTSWRVTAPLRTVSRRVKDVVPRPRATTLRARRDGARPMDFPVLPPTDPAAVLEVTGIPADEILRRCAALRAGREADRTD